MDGPASDFAQVFQDFEDFLAPRLDTYEQALYLYCFRHTRLVGAREAVIGFKSARKRLAMGIGEAGKPMSEGTCYKKLQSLELKKCIEIVDSTRDGTRLRVLLPSEIVGVVPAPRLDAPIPLESLDFFEGSEYREAIRLRESGRCFYCFRALDADNWLIEHVRSRPEGDNSYRNVVAACRSCNNRKGSSEARDFLRGLYRAGVLAGPELEDRLRALDLLEAGELKPELRAVAGDRR